MSEVELILTDDIILTREDIDAYNAEELVFPYKTGEIKDAVLEILDRFGLDEINVVGTKPKWIEKYHDDQAEYKLFLSSGTELLTSIEQEADMLYSPPSSGIVERSLPLSALSWQSVLAYKILYGRVTLYYPKVGGNSIWVILEEPRVELEDDALELSRFMGRLSKDRPIIRRDDLPVSGCNSLVEFFDKIKAPRKALPAVKRPTVAPAPTRPGPATVAAKSVAAKPAVVTAKPPARVK